MSDSQIALQPPSQSQSQSQQSYISIQQILSLHDAERTSLLTTIHQLILEKMIWRKQAMGGDGGTAGGGTGTKASGDKHVQDRLSALIADMHVTPTPANITTPAHILLYHDYTYLLNSYNQLLEQYRSLQTTLTEQTERMQVAESVLHDRDTRLDHLTTIYTQRSHEVSSLRETLEKNSQMMNNMITSWEHAKKEMEVRYIHEISEIHVKHDNEMNDMKEKHHKEIIRIRVAMNQMMQQQQQHVASLQSSQSIISLNLSTPSQANTPTSPSSPIHSPSPTPPSYSPIPITTSISQRSPLTIHDISPHDTVLPPITNPSSPEISIRPLSNGVHEDANEGATQT